MYFSIYTRYLQLCRQMNDRQAQDLTMAEYGLTQEELDEILNGYEDIA